MTCKSHVLIVVLALLVLVPDDVQVWHAVPDRVHSTMAAETGASLVDAGADIYRCGLGPAMIFLAGIGFFGLLILLTYVVGRARRERRINHTRPEGLSLFLAKIVLTKVMRIHFVMSAVGFAAVFVAFGIDAPGYGVLLALLSMVVLSRADTSRTTLNRLDQGTSVERRAEVLRVTSPEAIVDIRASKRIFRAAESIALPTASLGSHRA